MVSDIAGIILGVLMCFAGGTKIALGSRWPIDARAMRAPQLVTPVLPWVEIVIGSLLVSRVQTTVIGLAALVLLCSFSILILANLRAGYRPVCACFGNFRPRPLGWRHLFRNGVLATLAVISILG
jgi:hypothetical protein